MKYRAIKSYTEPTTKPIEIVKGEKLIVIKESDPLGDWPNWLYCQGDKKEGWVPKQIIALKGTIGVSLENYCAKEFTLVEGETLVSYRQLNGWIWGIKANNPGNCAWAPLNCLEKID